MPRVPAEVRRAGVEDIDDVLMLWRQAREELDRAGRQLPSTGQVRPRLLEAMTSGDVEVVIARWDGRPAGFLVMRVAPMTLLVETPSVHVEQLYVAPDLRRHGIARALLGGVVARADRSCAEQVVTSVVPWARDTHRFFARLGFTPLVVRRAVATSVLRRRLAGESPRGALEDLLSRRRSLRARSRLSPGVPQRSPGPAAERAGDPVAGATTGQDGGRWSGPADDVVHGDADEGRADEAPLDAGLSETGPVAGAPGSEPDAGPPVAPLEGDALDALEGGSSHPRDAEPPVGTGTAAGAAPTIELGGDLTVDLGADRAHPPLVDPLLCGEEVALPGERPTPRVGSATVGGAP